MRGEFVAHSRRRLAAVVGEHDFVAAGERVTHSLCQRIARGRRRAEATRRHFDCIIGRPAQAGRHHRQHDRGRGAREKGVDFSVQLRSVGRDLERPRGGECFGDRTLFVDHVATATAHVRRVAQDDSAALRQYVEQRRVGVDQPREPVLHSFESAALRDAFPLLGAPRLARGEFACALHDGFVDDQLARRIHDDLVEFRRAALVVHRESRDPLDLVAPQLDAHRFVVDGGEHVENRPAVGELTAVLGELLAHVSPLDERALRLFDVERAAASHDERFEDEAGGGETLQQRAHRRHDDARRCVGSVRSARRPQLGDQLHAFAHRLDARAHALERQRLPRGEVVD